MKHPKWVQKLGRQRWRGWAYVGEAGARKRVFGPTRTTAEEAHLDAVKMRHRAQSGVGAHELSFAAACEAVRAEIEATRSAGYLTWWESQAKALRAHFPGSGMLYRITSERIQGFVTRRLETVAPATVAHNLRALSLVMRWAMHRGILDRNPLDRVKRPSVQAREMHYFEMGELKRLLKRAQPRDAAIATLLALTGLRRAELLRLRWEDVRPGAIWVRGKRRHEELPIGTAADECLERLRWDGEMVLGPQKPDTVLRCAFRRLRAIDPRFHPHALRHTYATALVRAGHPIHVVQRLMRVSSVQMVLRYFHHDEAHRKAAQSLHL